jgi:hypothetical protein
LISILGHAVVLFYLGRTSMLFSITGVLF